MVVCHLDHNPHCTTQLNDTCICTTFYMKCYTKHVSVAFEYDRTLVFPNCEVVSMTCFCLYAKKEDAILQTGYHDDVVIIWIKLYFSYNLIYKAYCLFFVCA